MHTNSCLLIKSGIIVLFSGSPEYDESNKAITYEIMQYGLLLKTYGFKIPLPEVVIKHLLETGSILVYYQPEDNYVATPLFNIALDLKLLAEAKGEFNFVSKQATRALGGARAVAG